MKWNRILLLNLFLAFSYVALAQNSIEELSAMVKKNDYAILEVRLNMEDEFRTLEGRESEGLSRVALYAGNNDGREVLSKGFTGYNQVVNYINKMHKYGWKLVDTYPIKGQSLLMTHYVFRKVKN